MWEVLHGPLHNFVKHYLAPKYELWAAGGSVCTTSGGSHDAAQATNWSESYNASYMMWCWGGMPWYPTLVFMKRLGHDSREASCDVLIK